MKLMLQLIFALLAFNGIAQYAQPGFYEVNMGSNWNFPMQTVFDQSNRMFVAERAGKIYVFQNNIKTLILDISEEVSTFNDEGLLSIALDPNFNSNGFLYLYYAVDRHYLLNFGTPSYNATTNEFGVTIARVTRFTVNIGNYTETISGSRFVLLGTSKADGFPLVGDHAGGQLLFASDGSLLLSCGDGSYQGESKEQQAYNEGFISTEEYNAGLRWRSQITNSLTGKILRLNPGNGDGYYNNPYYNGSLPRSAASRMYVRGIRNAFRMSIKPGTGTGTFPGVLYINDVGQDQKEELNIATAADQNFGWPAWEGIDLPYQTNNPALIPATWTKPKLEWGRANTYARTMVGNTPEFVINLASEPENFTGGASIAGAFYHGTKYPAEFQYKYFFCDFNNKWARYATLDANNNVTDIKLFNPNLTGLINLAYNPFDECFYFCTVTNKVVKIDYNPYGNIPPVAKFRTDKVYGNSPMTVNLVSESFDANQTASTLFYYWGVSDGYSYSGTGLSNITHTFNETGQINREIKLIVTDNTGQSSEYLKTFYINNTPPKVQSTSVDNIDKIPASGSNTTNFNSVVTDNEGGPITKTWNVFLFHNDHKHLYNSSQSTTSTFNLNDIPCDNLLYFYRIEHLVSDQMGLTNAYYKDIYVNCNPVDILPPSLPLIKVNTQTANNTINLNWTTPSDNIGVKFNEINVDGIGIAYLDPSINSYILNDETNVTGNNKKIKIISRDQAGNKAIGPTAYFTFIGPTNDTQSPDYIQNINLNYNTKTLNWAATNDNTGINPTFYIYYNGIQMGQTTGLSFTFTNIFDQNYLLEIIAKDNAGNVSTGTPLLGNCTSIVSLISPVNNLSSGSYNFKAGDKILGKNQILGTSNVIFDAKNSITLESGFIANTGTVFFAKIGGCN
jgi:glucose/arabinose dehydrogenase